MTSPMRPIELNTVLLALRRLQKYPVAVREHGPLLGADEIDELCERLNTGSEDVITGWARSILTDAERERIEDANGIIEHMQDDVAIDPTTGERWALCWFRVQPEQPSRPQLELRLPPVISGRRSRPGGDDE